MLCDLRDMLAEASRLGFHLPCFDVPDLALATAAMEAAADMDAAIVLHPTRDIEVLMPALTALARLAPVPTALVIGTVGDREDAALAIRLGAGGLGAPVADHGLLADMAESCAVALLPPPGGEAAAGLAWLGAELAEAVAVPVARRHDESDRPLSWEALIETAHKSARARAAAAIGKCGAAGRSEEVRTACRPRREVEHVIFYNADSPVDDMVGVGLKTLSQVPGVRRVFAGKALTDGAPYAHAWVVRFADAGVVPYYRDHPMHQAFADCRFRPVAGDRMTIDFVEEG